MSSEWAIRVHNLSKTYRLYDRPGDRGKQWILPAVQTCLGRKPAQYYREVHAVEDVSFEVKKGETLGIIGRNGSGKSTLLQLIVGTLSPTGGTIEIDGRVAALLELGAGFHPEFTGRENVYLNAALLGLSREDVDVQLDDILAFADIGIAADQPVKTYSSGMIVRLAFAVIAHVKADILIIDEALAVGDAFFVQKCMRFLRAFMEHGTVLFVSHDSAAVLSLCRNALWLDHGRVADMGEAKSVCDRYLNPQASHGNVPRGAMFGESETRAVSDDGAGAQWLETSGLFGERRACIEKVAFRDASGRVLHTVQASARVSLLVWCQTSIQLLSPIVGFVVRDRLGQSLFGGNVCVAGQGSSSSTIVPGTRFVAELEFMMPVLHAGDYSLSVALAEGTQEHHVQYHWIHDALTFSSNPSELCFGLIAVELLHVELHRLVTQNSHNENANDSVAL
ncbi:ABC-type polysaccharide transport system, ATPase component [Nitrospira defluvii]|jgi:lipopolysaccharide transport system ATP-binding protein|uniref:ABC-type polysaccharide transport system, ATPase component n=1 Tax=Nitrospira defluvii TaxID=330214 RepID=D8PIN1_9BACT|nr:ABC-type polysaccharide transport system, ATPase component [Nitrospira defluvii]